MNPSDHIYRFSKLLELRVIRAEKISEGKNSRIFKLSTIDRRRYAAKVYYHQSTDKRDRFGTELSAVKFLMDNGIRCIQQPIVSDPENRIVIFEFVEGLKIESTKITSENIDTVCRFLIRLDAVKSNPGAERIPPASEAFFSIGEILENVQNRFHRLNAVAQAEACENPFRIFLEKTVAPFFSYIFHRTQQCCNQKGIDWDLKISKTQQTLSPSDVGLHNIIRRKDGRLIFLDLEYFGWDDPAKLIIDFILHPAMHLDSSLSELFIRNMLTHFDGNGELKERLYLLYPIFGIKWSLILLNEFIPDDYARRRFAENHAAASLRDVQNQQLIKAKKMLARIQKNCTREDLFNG